MVSMMEFSRLRHGLSVCLLKERNERERFRPIDDKNGTRANSEFVSGFLPSMSWTAAETLVYSTTEKWRPPGAGPILC